MVKKLLTATLVVLFALAASAVIPRLNKAELQEKALSIVKTADPAQTQETVSSGVEYPGSGQPAHDLLQTLAEKDFVPVSFVDTAVSPEEVLSPDSVVGVAKEGGSVSMVPPMKKKRAGAAPKIVAGTLISKDVNYKNSTHSFRMTLDATDTEGVYDVSNVYGLGTTIKVNVDVTTGEVTIPQQKIYDHSVYGEINIFPIEIRDGFFYFVEGDVKGTLSDDGTISLGSWALGISDKTNEEHYGKLLNIYKSSDWNVPNAEVSCYNISQDKVVMYEILMEQTQPNELMLYGFGNINSSADILAARLTSDKRVVISQQVVLNNAIYGPFCNYSAEFTLNTNTNKWSVKVDRSGNMTLKDEGEGTFKLDGWVISARANPSSMIAVAYNDVTLFTDMEVSYPAPIALDLKGEGTEASPYLIETLTHVQALSQAVEGGQSFEGVYFALGADLDFAGASATAYVPVGTATTPFQGVLDGKNHKITNFSADGKGFGETGFFGVLGDKAKVKDIVFEGAYVTATGANVGVLAGTSTAEISGITVSSSLVDCNGELGGGIVANATGGSITDCSFSGNVTSVGSAAGIAAEALNTTISGCEVKANIAIDGYQSSYGNRMGGGIVGTSLRSKVLKCHVSGMIQDGLGYAYIGGVAAYANGSEISESFNAAVISAKRASFGSPGSSDDGDTNTGGIVGYISASELTDCYNAGTIIKTDKSEGVGGIIGFLGVGYASTSGRPMEMINISTVKNCYNSGQIISTSESINKGVLGRTFVSQSYVGPSSIERCISNCYFDSQIMGFDHPEWGLTTRELTSRLPDGFDSSKWTLKNGNYPVLATGNGTQAQEISAMPVVLREVDNSSKVKVSFEVTPSANVEWALNYDEEAGETATETKALRMQGSKVVVKDMYANALVNAGSKDKWSLKLYRLAVVPKVFDGEGVAGDPYIIKAVSDFQKLHEAVSVYKQSHKGDYFVMANDIDFSDTEDFNGVGYGATGNAPVINQFCGIFNGLGHAIHGLKIDGVVRDDKDAVSSLSSYYYTGLFSYIGESGVVRNLVIADDCDLMHYSYGGSVAGVNQGLVENCRNYAAVNAMMSYAGGIVGYNNTGGVINKCYNAGAVSFGSTNAGGIAGYNTYSASVQLCQNDADVLNKSFDTVTAKTKTNTLGGIVGTNYGKVERSVNNGQVRGFNSVGGIVGTISPYYEEGDVVQCVNNGVVNVLESTLYRGGIVGELKGDCKLSANYYDSSVNVNGGVANSSAEGVTGLSSSELVAGTALEGLPAEDFDFSPNAYPVLKAFANEAASKAMRSIYVAFAPKQMRTNVLTEVPLAKTEGIQFKLEKNENFKIEGDKLTVVKPEGMTVAADSITATLGVYAKAFNLNAVPVILDGKGEKEDPYLIKSKEDWNLLADFIASSKWEYAGDYFRIENDIDFAGDSIRIIAVDGVNFQAELDGAGHTIKNYVYSNNNSIKTRLQGPNLYVGKYLGLIGTLGNTGVVKNLTLNGDFKGHSYIGSAVGNNYGVIDGVTNKGNVETLTDGYASGIACRSYAGSAIRNSVNEGTVLSKKTYASGIVYQTYAGSLVENCINKGSVTATTTYTSGIAHEISGGIKDCVNEGQLEATGTVSGIAYKVGVDGWMDGCVNKSDIDLSTLTKPGGSISGVVNTTPNRTDTSAEDGGYIRNSHNEGNLKGGASIFGFIATIGQGWKVSDCSNTGDIESTGLATGFANKAGGGKALANLSEVDRCFNTGNVKANAAKSSGFIGELAKYSRIADCYNLGNVDNAYVGITTAGLVSQHNGLMERCFNAGDVVSAGYAVGGVAGYIASGDVEYPATIRNCFNIGNVTSTYTGTNTNGNAGGLGGYLSTAEENTPHVVENCYNTGNVTAERRVAGLFAGAFRPWSVVRNCYNSGKITCLQPDDQGRYYWSGTTFTNNYEYTSNGVTSKMLAGHENCFYDAERNPGNEFRSVTGSKKTTRELRDLEISEAYVSPEFGGHPVLVAFKDNDAAAVGSALLLLTEGSEDTYDNVTGTVTLVGPEGCEWTATDIADEEEDEPAAQSDETSAASTVLKIEGATAVPTASGRVKLTCNYKGLKKDFELTVEYTTSAVEESFGAKEVKEVVLIDLQGRKVADPEAGQVYIVRTVYTDGTMKVEKKIARN